jgi:hypothetical protein
MAELMDSLTRALQLAHLFQSLKQGPEDRAWQLQQRQQEQQDRQRAMESQDFNTRMGLQNIGAIPQTDMLKNLTSALGSPSSHTLMKTPVGPEYVPTEETRSRKGIEDYYNKERAKTLADTEPLALPAEMGGGTTRVKLGTKIENLIKLHNAANPTLHFEAKSNQDGTTVLGLDPKTGEERVKKFYPDMKADKPLHFVVGVDDSGTQTVKTFDGGTGKEVSTTVTPGVGKTKTESEKSPAQYNKARIAKAQFERARADALKLHQEADVLDSQGEEEKAQMKRAEADTKLQYASTLADDLQTNFSDFIEAGQGEKDTKGRAWPYAKFTANAPSDGVGAQSPAITDSQGKAKLALDNYRKMPAEQRDKVDPKAGISPRQWFLKRFGYDPDSVK